MFGILRVKGFAVLKPVQKLFFFNNLDAISQPFQAVRKMVLMGELFVRVRVLQLSQHYLGHVKPVRLPNHSFTGHA